MCVCVFFVGTSLDLKYHTREVEKSLIQVTQVISFLKTYEITPSVSWKFLIAGLLSVSGSTIGHSCTGGHHTGIARYRCRCLGWFRVSWCFTASRHFDCEDGKEQWWLDSGLHFDGRNLEDCFPTKMRLYRYSIGILSHSYTVWICINKVYGIQSQVPPKVKQ